MSDFCVEPDNPRINMLFISDAVRDAENKYVQVIQEWTEDEEGYA